MKTIKLDSESVIANIETRHTGGHIYVDYITLKDGTIISFTNEVVCVFRNAEAEENNDEIGHIYF